MMVRNAAPAEIGLTNIENWRQDDITRYAEDFERPAQGG